MANDDPATTLFPGRDGNNRVVQRQRWTGPPRTGTRHDGERGGATEQLRRSPDSTGPVRGRRSFADVARDHLDRLYGFCVRLTDDPSDADDLVQETLLRGMRAMTTFVTRAGEGLAVRHRDQRWRDLRARAAKSDDPLDDLDVDGRRLLAVPDDRDRGPFPYSDELHLDFLRLFRDDDVRAVFGRSHRCSVCPLILTVVHGFSCKEAAAILDIPLGTLLSRLHRGRKQLERGLWDYAVTNGLVRPLSRRRP